MSTRGKEEEEDWFSDAREEVSSVSDCNSEVADEFVESTGELDQWALNPESVNNRRHKFFQSMGFSFKKRDFDIDLPLEDSCPDHVSPPLISVSETSYEEEEEEENEEELSRNESYRSSVSSISARGSFKNIDDQIGLTRNYSSNSSIITTTTEGLSESGSSRSGSSGDFHNYEESPRKGGAKRWLKKLTNVFDKYSSSDGSRRRKLTQVQSFKKQFKELSSLCIGQEFSAHDGSIVVMKFSNDGKYLATAGEDCVVRVWNITQEDNKFEFDSSSNCVYFGMNEKSQIEPLNAENDKTEKSRRLLRRKSEPICAVLPSRVFNISETPEHEFRGHLGEILDLSWSDKGFLLSSSVDETVRLWRVGSSDECIKVFSHSSFVTCVAFNPMDDNYFISGSTDGKVRMWDVSCFRVVDYKDIREIVTAVCYRPDGKGAVVGSMTGECRFYNTIDNQLEFERQITTSLHGKKKVPTPSKRITGFQFFHGDSDKVMITSADSQIQVICGGVDTVCKLKKATSLRSTVTMSPTFASFTSDGKHIVSTIEDSGIHVWDYSNKINTIRSYEGFLSENVSVAIPWLGQGKEDATTWPEERLLSKFNTSMPNLWGLVIVTATWDGRIRVFHNYGLPIRV